MSINALIRRVSEITYVEELREDEKPRIVVIGIGGAGCNAVTRMKKLGLKVPTIAINTDYNHLQIVEADKKVVLKKVTGGVGTGGDVEIGERSALMARKELKRLVEGVDVVFIATGLGGGTGTGVTPVMAELARDSGALVITIATLPFKVEKARFLKAKKGLVKIMNASNTLIVIENDKLMEVVPHLPLNKAFMVMDQLMSYTIMSFVDVVTKPSIINVDLTDLRSVMERGGLSTILISEGEVSDPRGIVIDALNRPFVMDMDYSKASGAVIHVTTGEDAPLSSMYMAIDAISSFLKKEARIIIGARIAPEFENRMRILVILTGIKLPIMEDLIKLKGMEEKKKRMYDIDEI